MKLWHVLLCSVFASVLNAQSPDQWTTVEKTVDLKGRSFIVNYVFDMADLSYIALSVNAGTPDIAYFPAKITVYEIVSDKLGISKKPICGTFLGAYAYKKYSSKKDNPEVVLKAFEIFKEELSWKKDHPNEDIPNDVYNKDDIAIRKSLKANEDNSNNELLDFAARNPGYDVSKIGWSTNESMANYGAGAISQSMAGEDKITNTAENTSVNHGETNNSTANNNQTRIQRPADPANQMMRDNKAKPAIIKRNNSIDPNKFKQNSLR